MNALFNSKTVLCALGVVGILGIHGRSGADGTTALISEALDSPSPYNLPGTDFALLKSFTGFWPPLDYMLSMLVLFWWETVDGSHPATSAIAVYFLAQLLPCVVVLYLNALRGKKPNLVKPTLWLLLFQTLALGATGFIWALVYTITSPTVNTFIAPHVLQSSSIISSLDFAWLLPPALVLGYVVPSILMALSSTFMSNTVAQYVIAVWNMFPALVLALFYLLRLVLAPSLTRIIEHQAAERELSSPDSAKSASVDRKTPTKRSAEANHLRVIRVTATLALIFSSIMHISIVGLSITTLLFPSIFPPAYLTALSPSALFLPPLASGPMSITPGDGVRGFLLWDQMVGYSTFLTVVFLELRAALHAVQVRSGSNKATPSTWVLGALGLVISLVFGPGSACLVGSWARDELLFGDW